MSDQAWAVVIGFATIIALRILDFYFPKGWISRWTRDHAHQVEQDALDDAELDKKRRKKDRDTGHERDARDWE